MAYGILRTEKIKSVEKLATIAAHHFRTRVVKNADAGRTANNRSLIGCDDGLIHAVQARIGERKIRKNGVVAVEVLMTASPEYFRDNPCDYGIFDQGKTTRFNNRAIEFLNAEFGAENVVSAICHLDEATPHIHAVIVPIDPVSDRLNASRWLDGKIKLSALQDRYFEKMSSLGLERGLKGSEAEHTTIQQYYGSLQNAKATPVPSLKVMPPPLMMTSSSRENWAVSESERIEQAQRSFLSPVEALAATSVINRDKARQAEKTAKKLAHELEQERAAAKKSKDIDLQRLLVQMRAKRVEQNGQYLVNGQSIFIEGQTFTSACQQIKGVGSIDLLMRVERFDYLEALTWINQQFGSAEASGAATAKAQHDAKNASQLIVMLPEPDDSLWSSISEHLVMQCQLDLRVIEWLHERARVFGASIHGENVACFAYRRRQRTVGVELCGVGQDKFRGFRGDKLGVFHLKTHNPAGVIIVESALDALALHSHTICPQVSAYKAFDIIALANGDVSSYVRSFRPYRRVVLAGLDNISQLDCIKAMIPHVECLRLDPGYSNWSDCLRSGSSSHVFSTENPIARNSGLTPVKR
jgi:hypothetical protein